VGAYSRGGAHFKFTIRLGALVVFKGTSNTGTPKELLF